MDVMNSAPETVIDAVRAGLARARNELEALTAIPSVGADPAHAPDVRRSAVLCAQILAGYGLENVAVLELPDAAPAVYADWLHAPNGAPTVLLYAHHDVQPPGIIENWTSDPFVAVERDGRLYGRGTSDDKAGAIAHAAAVGAWLRATGGVPCNVRVLIEGEEEVGSPNLERFLAAHSEQLASDVFVLADAGQWDVGEPGITASLRGLLTVDVELHGLRSPLHSGIHGGVVPDPAMELARLVSSMTDASGDIAIEGFANDVRALTPSEQERIAALPNDAGRFLAQVDALPGVQPAGSAEYTIHERLWSRPSLTIIGFDSHPIAGSSNQIVARARARCSFRLAPGQDPQRCAETVIAHVRSREPLGLHTTVTVLESTPAWSTETDAPAFRACERALLAGFGREAVVIGTGGSIPFVGPFAQIFGGIPALLIGPEDPYTRAHGEDESLHLDDWRKLIESEAHLLSELAALR
jgi:acetylornithine deacetylase/succinyl-diaminopimelate desuccinylase-like protein